MNDISFKERVRQIIISEARSYKDNLVNYEYLVCSDAFTEKEFYLIDAKEDNYQHLTGVNSLICAQEFFEKSYNGTLLLTDFDFIKRNQSEKSVIGSVRRKISVLHDMVNIFNNSQLIVQEKYMKNNIICDFSTTDGKCILGFVDSEKARPKSLIKGKVTDNEAKSVKLLMRKKIDEDIFDEVLIGNNEAIEKYYYCIKNYISIMCEEVAIASTSYFN